MIVRILRSLYVPAIVGPRIYEARYGYEISAPSLFFIWVDDGKQRRNPIRIDIAPFLKSKWGKLSSRRQEALERTMPREMDLACVVIDDKYRIDDVAQNPDLETWIATAKAFLAEWDGKWNIRPPQPSARESRSQSE